MPTLLWRRRILNQGSGFAQVHYSGVTPPLSPPNLNWVKMEEFSSIAYSGQFSQVEVKKCLGQDIWPSQANAVERGEFEAGCRTQSFAGALDHLLFTLQLVPPNTESSQTEKSTETRLIDLHKMLRCHHEERGNKTYELKRLNFPREVKKRIPEPAFDWWAPLGITLSFH